MKKISVPDKFNSPEDLHDFMCELKLKYGHGMTLGFPDENSDYKKLYFGRIGVKGIGEDHFLVFRQIGKILVRVDDFIYQYKGGSCGVFQAKLSDDGKQVLYLGGWKSEFVFKRDVCNFPADKMND